MSRLPASLAREIGARDSITLRVAHEEDTERLERLADLAGRELPSGDLIVAESDTELVAALSLRSGEAIGDPFQVTTDLVALLRVRANQLLRLAA